MRPGGSRRSPATQNGSLTGEHPAGRVLVVDDDHVNRMLLTRSLEREGHRVRCAEDGLGALEVLRRDPCDVVLLDIVMPELDGVSVLERIKSDPALQDVPVIIISGVDETESVLRCGS
jgi:adenylate cyclase